MENPTPISSTLLPNVPIELHKGTTLPTRVACVSGLTFLDVGWSSSCSLWAMTTTGVDPLTYEVLPLDCVIVVGELKLVLTTLDGAVRETP